MSEKTISMTEEELKQLIRDELAMFGHKGPGWWNRHDPLKFHRCGRCGFMLPMGTGCPCAQLGNSNIIEFPTGVQ